MTITSLLISDTFCVHSGSFRGNCLPLHQIRQQATLGGESRCRRTHKTIRGQSKLHPELRLWCHPTDKRTWLDIHGRKFHKWRRRTILGEHTRLSKLRTGHQSRGIRPESHHHRNRDMPELRLVRADRNTSCRSMASEEADISPFIALRRNGEWQLPELHTVPNAGHYAFLAPCTESLRQKQLRASSLLSSAPVGYIPSL